MTQKERLRKGWLQSEAAVDNMNVSAQMSLRIYV